MTVFVVFVDKTEIMLGWLPLFCNFFLKFNFLEIQFPVSASHLQASTPKASFVALNIYFL